LSLYTQFFPVEGIIGVIGDNAVLAIVASLGLQNIWNNAMKEDTKNSDFLSVMGGLLNGTTTFVAITASMMGAINLAAFSRAKMPVRKFATSNSVKLSMIPEYRPKLEKHSEKQSSPKPRWKKPPSKKIDSVFQETKKKKRRSRKAKNSLRKESPPEKITPEKVVPLAVAENQKRKGNLKSIVQNKNAPKMTTVKDKPVEKKPQQKKGKNDLRKDEKPLEKHAKGDNKKNLRGGGKLSGVNKKKFHLYDQLDNPEEQRSDEFDDSYSSSEDNFDEPTKFEKTASKFKLDFDFPFKSKTGVNWEDLSFDCGTPTKLVRNQDVEKHVKIPLTSIARNTVKVGTDGETLAYAYLVSPYAFVCPRCFPFSLISINSQ